MFFLCCWELTSDWLLHIQALQKSSYLIHANHRRNIAGNTMWYVCYLIQYIYIQLNITQIHFHIAFVSNDAMSSELGSKQASVWF